MSSFCNEEDFEDRKAERRRKRMAKNLGIDAKTREFINLAEEQKDKPDFNPFSFDVIQIEDDDYSKQD